MFAAGQYRWDRGSLAEQESAGRYQAFFEKHPRVFLYGAGHGAARMLRYLRACGLQAAGIVVGDGQSHAPEVDGLAVRELSQADIRSEDGVIVTLKQASQEAVVATLVRHGIREEQIVCQELFYQRMEEGTVDGTAFLPGVHKTGPYFTEEQELEAIGKETGTDKCSDAHDYLRKYEFFLRRFREQPMTLLELGVFHGDSLRMWSCYFPKAHIVGVDINENCLTNRGG